MSSPRLTAFWTAYSRVYDGLLNFWPYQHLLDLMQSELQADEGHRLLDLGCGTGNLLNRLLHDDKVVATGVDISTGMLNVARKKLSRFTDAGALDLHEGDIIGFLAEQETASFDRISSVNVLYILKDQETLWREMLRVLKPDGRIVVTTSDRKANWPIIREQLQRGSLLEALRPKLFGVFVFDIVIHLMGSSHTLPFNDEDELRRFVEAAGGNWLGSQRCYGGEKDGVNILFAVSK